MRKIAYVSFETKRPAIYVQDLATGQREKLASFRGLNGAPSFSRWQEHAIYGVYAW